MGEKVKELSKGMPQLDGLRAFCLISIIIHHWSIEHVHLSFPFEIGAFLFFSLSGYLITGILLRSREKVFQQKTSFRQVLSSFSMRRLYRLIPGYMAALVLYLILFTPEVWSNLGWYLTNSSNIHFALAGKWGSGADQFWTLAVDQQFYLVWPFIILFCPKKMLPAVLILIGFLAPCSRLLAHTGHPFFAGEMKDKLPWFLTDHLCAGSLLAVVHQSKFKLSRIVLWIGLLVSLTAYLGIRYGWVDLPEKWMVIQQSILALFSTFLVALAATGFKGIGKVILEHAVVLKIGAQSYGYYLYHNLALLFLGRLMPFFWWRELEDSTLWVRYFLAAVVLWGMVQLSWKYIELPFLQKKRNHQYS